MRAIALFFLYVAMFCSVTTATAQQETPERERTEKEFAESLPPLMLAASKGRVDEVRRLLKEGADVKTSAIVFRCGRLIDDDRCCTWSN